MARSPRSFLALSVLILLILCVSAVPLAAAQADLQGQWSTASYQMPLNAVHIALMHNGKLLIIAGSGNCPPSQAGCPSGAPFGPSNNSGALVLDPGTGSITQISLSWDMFCNGMVVLPDGRPFINGGTLVYDPFHGTQKSAVFDPATNTFTDVSQNMAHGRWYPTATVLGDGRIMTFSGVDENGSTNTTVEIYTVGTGWSSQYSAGWTPPLYPRMTLLPSGKVLYSGSDILTRLFDPSKHTWSTVGNRAWNGERIYDTAVLLPMTPANNFRPKVMAIGGGYTPTATTEFIDMGAPNPAWVLGPSMSQNRIEQNAVLLPNQKVVVVGGSSKDEDATTASLNADIYDPAANTFNNPYNGGAAVYPRLYHSNALLLPDATVWVGGSNPVRGQWEPHVEIYKPAYLFTRDGNNNIISATRPTITSVPGNIAWGAGFTVSTPDAAKISRWVRFRPGAPTHATDMEQRLVGMSFTKNSSSLSVTAPSDGNLAPPGYYMLFIVNSSGVPSVAKFVQLGSTGSNPAPTVTAISPTSGTPNGGTGVTITGTGFLSGATVTFGGTAATGVTVASSTSITATTPAHSAGPVNVVVTNTDSQSGTLTNGYTYTSSNPAPTVTSVSPSSGTTAGGTAVTITGTGFLSGATVTFGGNAATGVTVASSTSITANTPSHAAGAVNVVVTNTDSQSGTLTNGYTYTSSGGGSAAFVQVNAATPQTTSAAVALSYSASQTAGNLNIVAVGWNDTTASVSSVTDSRGNTYVQAGSTVSGTALRQVIYYAKNIAPGTNTVTVAFSPAAAYVDLRILEYSGLDTASPLDVTAGAAGSGISPNSGAATTTAANELIFGAGITADGFSGAGTGFTSRIITTPDGDIAEDKVVSNTGSNSAAAPLKKSSYWVMQMATFKASGQGGGNPAPTVSSVSPTSGTTAGGTAVTITGTGFLSGATVSFGGTAATSVTVVNSGSITATTPAHAAGAVNVVVTNTDAQSGTLTNGYTYTTSNPAPTVTSVSPTSGTTAGGTAVTITGTGFLSGATVTFGGTAATGVTVVGSTSITATTPAHAAGAVNVVVTNTDAQSGTKTNGYTYTTSNPAPTVTSVSPTSGTTAGGTAVTITGTGFLSGATVTFGGTAATGVTVVGSTSITATTPAHAAGAVNVVVTNTDAQSGTLTNGYTYTTSSGGSIAFVQVNAATPQTSSSSVALGFLVAQTAGSLNIVAVGWNDTTASVSSVTDSRGNTYVQAGTTVSGTALRQAIYYAKNITAGSNTVTVTFNQAAAFVDLRILEYSGADTTSPLDVTAGAAGNSISPSSGAATTTTANELIFGAGITADGFAGAGTGFTSRIITTPDGDIAEDKVVSSTGSNSAAAPLKKSSYWVMQMATFKAAP